MIGKLRLLFWLGIIMLFLPFFGIPNTWKTIIAVGIGVLLISLSLSLRKKYRSLRHTIRTLEQHTEPSHE
jgi:O-antigen/teichoic acid export membrane protein